MRRLFVLVTTLVLLVVAVVAVGELIVKPIVERRIGEEVQQRYGLAARPAVRIDSFPFLIDAARGRLDRTQIDVEALVVEGLTIERAQLDAHGVRFRLSEVIDGAQTARADRVDARIDVTAPDLNQYLRQRSIPLTISFTGGRITAVGAARVAGRNLSGQATGNLTVTASTLHFDPTDVRVTGTPLDALATNQVKEALAFDVALPTVVGVTITDVALGNGRAELRAVAFDQLLAGDALPTASSISGSD